MRKLTRCEMENAVRDIRVLDLLWDHYNRERFAYPYRGKGLAEKEVFVRFLNLLKKRYQMNIHELRQSVRSHFWRDNGK